MQTHLATVRHVHAKWVGIGVVRMWEVIVRCWLYTFHKMFQSRIEPSDGTKYMCSHTDNRNMYLTNVLKDDDSAINDIIYGFIVPIQYYLIPHMQY